jgi:hypothetical protein
MVGQQQQTQELVAGEKSQLRRNKDPQKQVHK